jgi:hypothetical protein
VRDGRWRVLLEADTLETAIRRVAECLATRGRNLTRPEQPLGARASRDAHVLAHRYDVSTHHWPLIDVAVTYGMTLSHAHQTIAGMITRAAQFELRSRCWIPSRRLPRPVFHRRPLSPMSTCVTCLGRRCPWKKL